MRGLNLNGAWKAYQAMRRQGTGEGTKGSKGRGKGGSGGAGGGAGGGEWGGARSMLRMQVMSCAEAGGALPVCAAIDLEYLAALLRGFGGNGGNGGGTAAAATNTGASSGSCDGEEELDGVDASLGAAAMEMDNGGAAIGGVSSSGDEAVVGLSTGKGAIRHSKRPVGPGQCDPVEFLYGVLWTMSMYFNGEA